MAVRANALGDYLRARREQLCPEDVGLVAGMRRRVTGLRREEVATLAGISSAYYLRLEQGRDTRPSEQVVEALARALLLDLKATEYLHRLATGAGNRRPQPAGDTVAEGLRQLIDQVSVPVILGNRYMDVLIEQVKAEYRLGLDKMTAMEQRLASIAASNAADQAVFTAVLQQHELRITALEAKDESSKPPSSI